MPRRQGGLLATPPGPPPGRGSDRVGEQTADLIGAVKRAVEAETAARLARDYLHPAPAAAPPLPQPGTAGEVVSMAQAVVGMHKDAAATAQAERDAATRRAQSLEERVAVKLSAARRLERHRAQGTAALLERVWTQRAEAEEKAHAQALELERVRAESERAKLEARLDRFEDQLQAIVAAKDGQISQLSERLQQTQAAAASKKSLEERLAEALFDGGKLAELRTQLHPFLGAPAAGGMENEDPNVTFQRSLAPEMARVMADAARDQVYAARDERAQKQQQAQAWTAVARQVGGALEVVKAVAAQAFGVDLTASPPTSPEDAAWPDGAAEHRSPQASFAPPIETSAEPVGAEA